jgi:ribonuclease R
MDGNTGRQRQTLQAIARHALQVSGFETDFPAAALAELKHIDHAATPSGKDVKDMRSLLWCSIDNDDSRDLDQLTVGERLPDGSTRVYVAVADVDALVTKGTALDEHAQHNTTSIYTPAQIFPMLPEKLSTDLTSLAANADRLSVVVEMDIDATGATTRSSVYRAWVRNQAKLAYPSVGAWLAGQGAPPAAVSAVKGMDDQLHLQNEAALRMRHLRHEHGALAFQTIETHAVFDGDTLTSLLPEEKDLAKGLIEDFMIAANTAVAAFLAGKGFSSIRRVVRTPKRWSRIVEIAAGLGTTLSAEPDGKALSAFLSDRQRKDPDHFPDLSLSVIKLLGSGEYIVETPGAEDPGHFGLAVKGYSHSTAPNRRYPDVITQRLLKAALGSQPAPYDANELGTLAQHCTEREDAAQKVERQVSKSAAAMLLSGRIGDTFDGIVTGASEAGTYVRIFDPPAEGRVTEGSAGLDVGERVRVKLAGTNVDRGWIDFSV